jgi:hypothetical protein
MSRRSWRTSGEMGKCVLPMIEKLPDGYSEALMMSEDDLRPRVSWTLNWDQKSLVSIWCLFLSRTR